MNTIAFKVPDAMARDTAHAADVLGMPSNDAVAFEALRLFLISVTGKRRGRPYKHKALKPASPARARRRRG